MVSKKPTNQMKPHVVIDWESVPLGRKPDEEIAASLGVAVSVVASRRRTMGLKPFNKEVKLRGSYYEQRKAELKARGHVSKEKS